MRRTRCFCARSRRSRAGPPHSASSCSSSTCSRCCATCSSPLTSRPPLPPPRARTTSSSRCSRSRWNCCRPCPSPSRSRGGGWRAVVLSARLSVVRAAPAVLQRARPARSCPSAGRSAMRRSHRSGRRPRSSVAPTPTPTPMLLLVTLCANVSVRCSMRLSCSRGTRATSSRCCSSCIRAPSIRRYGASALSAPPRCCISTRPADLPSCCASCPWLLSSRRSSPRRSRQRRSPRFTWQRSC
mmetsp:Transcript_5812/g.13501  ORF Transcript_5812/g.13501 Transcript_5812/m.13501 type:complete len:241 (-) Transcript_5812:1868-2590(-)